MGVGYVLESLLDALIERLPKREGQKSTMTDNPANWADGLKSATVNKYQLANC
jgi:hypothetical protein